MIKLNILIYAICIEYIRNIFNQISVGIFIKKQIFLEISTFFKDTVLLQKK